MTLRNAFDALALDSSIQKMLDGYVTNPATRKVLDNKFFIVGEAITLSGGLTSTSRPVLQVVNPPLSNKLVFIVGLTVYATVAQQVEYIEDATMNGGGALPPQNLNRASGVVSEMEAYWSDTAPSLGTPWPNQSRVTPTSPLELQFPGIILPPNKSFAIMGSSSEAQTFTANAYFLEEPIPA